MKKRFVPFILSICMLCVSTMTSCSAAELPSAAGRTAEELSVSAFPDVPADAWYAGAVGYVREHGVMGGYGNGRFGPEDTLSRAQLAQILYNLAGRPAVSGQAVFPDVAADSWCAAAVDWASENGVISGYAGGVFGANDPATREQAVAILWRYGGSPKAVQRQMYPTRHLFPPGRRKQSGGQIPAASWMVC